MTMDPSIEPTTEPDAAPFLALTSCPECGHPAEIEWRTVLDSTDGPIEHARVTCVQRHWFLLPVHWLTRPAWPRTADGRPRPCIRAGPPVTSESIP